ncbi:TPA: hypothetical protein I8617_004065 [Citrobacter amalonaticus]|nr:hypothetical protein [Pluralibacter sp. S54_ASV_43]HAT3756999.1 hypothetical protein [Citrobacter amalonaticus]
MVNKFNLTVKSFDLSGENVSVWLDVHSLRAASMPLFSMQVQVERKENDKLSSYELEAIKKAASLIHDIANELDGTA